MARTARFAGLLGLLAPRNRGYTFEGEADEAARIAHIPPKGPAAATPARVSARSVSPLAPSRPQAPR